MLDDAILGFVFASMAAASVAVEAGMVAAKDILVRVAVKAMALEIEMEVLAAEAEVVVEMEVRILVVKAATAMEM